MAKVYIKYNPYKLDTTVLIDGVAVAENSELNVGSKRLQEWVEKLPSLLKDECNENYFELDFLGTSMDFEDVQESVNKSNELGIHFNLNHLPVKEAENKELAIEEIFDDIINGPIKELKSKDLVNAFKEASSDEFEITVVATMSAGKSTLINSLLQRKIMPSSQEACTATISRIKDNDDDEFFAIAYDEEGNKITTATDVQLNDMANFNSNESVSTICLEGNIPFTSSDDMSLVLIDTPGPNNSRDENHLKTTFKNLDESSKTLVLYVLNATQLGVNDDSKLLDTVAESMKVGGKQSKDRYLFVINKLDQFRKGDDDVEVSIERVRKYLADRGIHEPNLFPAAALTALDIRGLLNNSHEIDEELEEEIEWSARKFNKNKQLHLENFATLTPSIKRKLQERFDEVDDGDVMNLETALIHSGIPAVEETIKLYVEKYARTSKIKNVVDTFQKKLESSKAFEIMKNEIGENTERHEQIKNQIIEISEKLNSGKDAKEFEEKINQLDILPLLKIESKELLKLHQTSIDSFLTGTVNEEFTKAQADTFMTSFGDLAKVENAQLSIGLEKIINEQLVDVAKEMLNQYKEKVEKLVEGMSGEDLPFKPFELVEAELELNSNTERIFNNEKFIDKVKVGTKTYENPDRGGFFGWFKFWEPKQLVKDIYEDVEKIKAQVITDECITILEEHTRKLVKKTESDAKDKIKKLKFEFKRKFEELDQTLREKLKDLEMYTSDAESIQQLIQESKDKLVWLEKIEKRVSSIIELEEEVYS